MTRRPGTVETPGGKVRHDNRVFPCRRLSASPSSSLRFASFLTAFGFVVCVILINSYHRFVSASLHIQDLISAIGRHLLATPTTRLVGIKGLITQSNPFKRAEFVGKIAICGGPVSAPSFLFQSSEPRTSPPRPQLLPCRTSFRLARDFEFENLSIYRFRVTHDA